MASLVVDTDDPALLGDRDANHIMTPIVKVSSEGGELGYTASANEVLDCRLWPLRRNALGKR